MEKTFSFTLPGNLIELPKVAKLFEETIAKPFNALFKDAYHSNFYFECGDGDNDEKIVATAYLYRFTGDDSLAQVNFLMDGTAEWDEGTKRPIENWTLALKEILELIETEVGPYSTKIRAELANAAQFVTNIKK